MAAHGPVYLAASGEGDALATLAHRALHAVSRPMAAARVAVSYAPVEGDKRGLKFMSERMAGLFPGATLETLTTDRAVVDRADLVFVSGGDPTHGAHVLARSGADGWIREANHRGVPVMGVSAGAILLGDLWVDWGPDEDDPPPYPKARLVPCIGAASGFVFDAHDEEDDWQELRAAAVLLAARGVHRKLLGLPTGSGLVWTSSGQLEVVGSPPFSVT